MTYVNLLGVNSKHKGTRSVFVHVWSIDASLLKKATEVGQNIPKLKDAKTVQQCWCKLTSGWAHLKLIAHETTDSLRFLGRGEWWWWVTYDLWSLYDCEKLDILVHNALDLFWGRASWPPTTEVTLWPFTSLAMSCEKKKNKASVLVLSRMQDLFGRVDSYMDKAPSCCSFMCWRCLEKKAKHKFTNAHITH